MDEDRRKIHQLSDAIMKDLFGKEGVASSQLLFTMRTSHPEKEEKLSEVWICDYDGANARQITKENSYCVTPSFILSEKRDRGFLYVSYKIGQPKIYGCTLKHPEGKGLIKLRGNQLLPAISRQSDKIAFISDAAGRPDLFIQHFDAQGNCADRPVQLFSFPRATQASPAFSPDGKKIAFVSDKDGPPRIYIARIPNVSEKNRRPTAYLLTRKNRENITPNWSPDGTKLAYSAKTDGVRQIWVYDFETEEEYQLTHGPKHKENPCWAPNSLHLVYNSEDFSSSELYIVNLNQPDPVQITNGSGQKRFPAWEPKRGPAVKK